MTVVYVEGSTDEPFVTHICRIAGIQLTQVPATTGGTGQLDALLPKPAQAGRVKPILVFRNLDRDAVCAPTWLAANVQPLHAGELFHLRLEEAYPKLTITALARKSTNSTLKRRLVPRPGASRKTGPDYMGWLITVAERWCPERAREVSPSLDRTVKRLTQLSTSLNLASGLS